VCRKEEAKEAASSSCRTGRKERRRGCVVEKEGEAFVEIQREGRRKAR
jgi:hypothetical protein